MPQPFTLIDWKKNFVDSVVDIVYSEMNGNTASALILFPNARAKKYAQIAFRRKASTLNKTLILPKMLTTLEIIDKFALKMMIPVKKQASILDQTAIIYKIIKNIQKEISIDDENFADEDYLKRQKVLSMLVSDGGTKENEKTNSDLTFFMPWGIRIARLCEECMAQNIVPSSSVLKHIDGDVEPFAEALLKSMERIFKDYIDELVACDRTTPQHKAYLLAKTIKDKKLPSDIDPSNVFICGFGYPNGTENVILKNLWENGAHVIIQGDSALALGKKSASCKILSRWMSSWGTKCVNYDSNAPDDNCKVDEFIPDISLFAGHDLHSQLHALREDFYNLRPNGIHESSLIPCDTAIILANCEQVVPVLCTLSDLDFNVAMGYPFQSSPISNLLHGLYTMEENRHDDKIFWRDMIYIISHPYVRGLLASHEDYAKIDDVIRNGSSYLSVDHLFEEINLSDDEYDLDKFKNGLKLLLDTFHDISSANKMAENLKIFCDFLAGCEVFDNSFSKDAALAKIRETIIPQFEGSLLDREGLTLSGKELMAFLISMLDSETMPFESDEVEKLQVLDIDQTRLVNFKNIFIVDMCEENFPKIKIEDPLCPNSIRHVLGLRTAGDLEDDASYKFHRLISGAEKIFIYWQEGMNSKNIESRKTKSRFVEELIWMAEQKYGYLFEKGDKTDDGKIIFRAAKTHFPKLIPKSDEKVRNSTIEADSDIKAVIDDFLRRKPISPTVLDSYIRCPLRFLYSNLCGINQQLEADEENGNMYVGILMHKVLQEAYSPLLESPNTTMPSADEIIDIFKKQLKISGIEDHLSTEDFLIFKELAPMRIRDYAERCVKGGKLLDLEKSMSASFDIAGLPFSVTLYGKVDRFEDREDEGIIVLDYKTGKTPVCDTSIWDTTDKPDSLFARIENLINASDGGWNDDVADKILNDIRKNKNLSMQLPMYIYLAYRNGYENVCNAAFIPLIGYKHNSRVVNPGDEIPLFSKNADVLDIKTFIARDIPNLIKFVILHMHNCKNIVPNPDNHCAWCPYEFCDAKKDVEY